MRQFCQNCGSSLTFSGEEGVPELVEFALATLDTPIAQRPDVHIYTAYKASWYDISDDLPRYQDDRNCE